MQQPCLLPQVVPALQREFHKQRKNPSRTVHHATTLERSSVLGELLYEDFEYNF